MTNEYENTQFIIDLQSKDNINRNYNLGWYNLIISIRDLRLYSKGIKSHRRWKITPLKIYFGIKGNAKSMLDKLRKIKQTIKERGYKQIDLNTRSLELIVEGRYK